MTRRSRLSSVALIALLSWVPTSFAAAPVPADPNLVKPLAAGAAAPTFDVRRTDGNPYRFDARHRKSPAVLIFYRGGWCPYCNVHLGQLKSAEATLRLRGYEVLFLSSDRPELLHSSLKQDVQGDAANYTLLSDSAAVAARAFGVAYRLPDETVAQYKTYGVDLESTQGNAEHILPVPAVFVIDRKGKIRFAHFNPDYKIRLSANELLAAAPAVRK